MRRTVYGEDHLAFGDSFRQFLEKEVVPPYPQWEADGMVPHDLFAKAGGYGFLGFSIPEELGGGGVDDFRFNAILAEEAAYASVSPAFIGLGLVNDVVTPYLTSYCNEEQSKRWLPGIASGETVAAIAMTEPGTGSDLASIATRAVREGDHYIVNGMKTFITNGINADLVIVAVTTAPGERHSGLSLLVVERDTPGFTRGRKLAKMGLHAQDTAELSFVDAKVPVENLLGEEGAGFGYLVANLAQERLSIAVASVAAVRAALTTTLDYVKSRKAFGKPISTLQNTRFRLAEVATELDLAQTFVDQCLLAHLTGDLSAADAAKAKWWCTEFQSRAIDTCLQLHGGYGYMTEYSISRAYTDGRVSRIYGGTTEIMKEIIGRDLGL